jgi:hypothetical protein
MASNPSKHTVRAADAAHTTHGRDLLAVTRRTPTPTTYFLGRPPHRWRAALNEHRPPRHDDQRRGGP